MFTLFPPNSFYTNKSRVCYAGKDVVIAIALMLIVIKFFSNCINMTSLCSKYAIWCCFYREKHFFQHWRWGFWVKSVNLLRWLTCSPLNYNLMWGFVCLTRKSLLCWLMKTTVHVHLRSSTVDWYQIFSGMFLNFRITLKFSSELLGPVIYTSSNTNREFTKQ